MLKFRLELVQPELDSVTRLTGTATTDIRDILDTTRVAITATTVAILTTEHITTLGGRTTTAAIEFINITSIITTATKTQGLV